MIFRTWFEHILLEDDQPLRREQQEQVGKLYQQVVQVLLGGAKNQTNLSLSDIEDDGAGPGSPPIKKGAMVVLKKLDKAQIFNRIEKLQIPSLTQRAHEVQTYLQKIASDQQIGPKDTIGQLLNKLFGDNAVELYGKGLWRSSPGTTQQAPEDNTGQTTPDATAPPMADQAPEPPPGQMPLMNGQMPPEAQMPAPGMPPNPPNPNQMLPGGTPPRPPGGIF